MKKFTSPQIIVLCSPLITFLMLWGLFFAIYFNYIESLKDDQNIFLLVAVIGTIMGIIMFFILKKNTKEQNYIMEYGVKKDGIFVKTSFEYEGGPITGANNRVILNFESIEHLLPFSPEHKKDIEKLNPGDKVPIKCHPENSSKLIINWEEF